MKFRPVRFPASFWSECATDSAQVCGRTPPGLAAPGGEYPVNGEMEPEVGEVVPDYRTGRFGPYLGVGEAHAQSNSTPTVANAIADRSVATGFPTTARLEMISDSRATGSISGHPGGRRPATGADDGDSCGAWGSGSGRADGGVGRRASYRFRHGTQLGLERILHRAPSRMRDLALAAIIARVIAPASKLATARRLSPETTSNSLASLLQPGPVSSNQLLDMLDWLLKRQRWIERRLRRRQRVTAIAVRGLAAKRPRSLPATAWRALFRAVPGEA